MYTVKIIRHAERLDYTSPIQWFFSFGQYWADTPLTKNGCQSAHQKGLQIIDANFNPRKIYTSPYNRTIATATQIQKCTNNASIVIEPLISEYQQLWRHCTMIYPEGIPRIKSAINDITFEYPETYEKFIVRVGYALDYLLNNNNDDFVIVTHGAFLTAFMSIYNLENNDIIPSFTYLSTISFMYDTINHTILRSSVKIN